MRGAILSVGLLAVLSVMFGLAVLSEDSDASYASTFGSDSVGADRIVFDANGGSGGYAQYVINGNSVYFPTEYKASGTSNSTYQQISRNGYVLMGWSENSGASSPSYHPGQAYTVTGNKTFYAVWKSTAYDFSYADGPFSTKNVSGNSVRDLAAIGQSYRYSSDGDKCEPLTYLGLDTLNHDDYDVVLTASALPE